MNIQYYGDYCFKVTTKPGGRATEDVVVWTDLPDKETGLRTPFGHADIALLSHMEPSDPALSSLKDDPVPLYTPGEYSVRGVAVMGYPSSRDGVWGAERGRNTIFVLESEDVKLCFLGSLGHPLDEKTVAKIGDVDVLFVPVGGEDTITPKAVDELIREIEPRMVIPMHYAADGAKGIGSADAFCRELGCSMDAAVEKLNFKKKDIEGKSMEITFLRKG